MFSFWQEYRAEKALHALRRLLPCSVHAFRGGNLLDVPTAEIVPGDIILLEEGADVPADCRVIQAVGLRVSNATVTGESVPHSRAEDPDDVEDYQQSRNIVLAGTSIVSGRAKAVVFATGRSTAFGLIAALAQNAREGISPLQNEIAHVSRIMTGISLSLGVLFYFIGVLLGLPFWMNLVFAIGVIVANVPEGLLPTVTLSLAMAAQRMARRKALVRHLPAVETLGAATVICTDKTGTLTTNRMQASRLFIACSWIDAGGPEVAEIVQSCPVFFDIAGHCHSARIARRSGRADWVGDPTDIGLVELALKVAPHRPKFPRRSEIPFDSARRRMSTLHETAAGYVIYTKGAAELLIERSSSLLTRKGPQPMTAISRRAIQEAADEMANQGLRVLGLAFRQAEANESIEELEQSLTLAGLVGLEDPPRIEVAPAIRRCQQAGIKVIMVTGDHPITARAIAKKIGLFTSDSAVAITGEQMRRWSNTQLQLALDAPEVLFARVQADQKLRIVAALRRKREIVAVTGDGVNDAPALKRAHIGIAMGASGTDVARETADLVLLDDNFASIVAAVEEGRAVFANVQSFLTYILTSNIPELVPYLAYVLFQIPLPLTVAQILAVDLGTDIVPALALGANPPDPDLMQRPPRARHERLLSGGVLLRSYGFLGIMEAAAGMAAYWLVLTADGWRVGTPLSDDSLLYRKATTACLTAIVVMQVANVFLCASATKSVLHRGLGNNRLLIAGITIEAGIIFAIDYTPIGNLLFGTAALPGWVWFSILPFAAGMILLEELRKWRVRSRNFGSRTSVRLTRSSRPLAPRMPAQKLARLTCRLQRLARVFMTGRTRGD